MKGLGEDGRRTGKPYRSMTDQERVDSLAAVVSDVHRVARVMLFGASPATLTTAGSKALYALSVER